MKKSKLITLLKIFSKEEIKDFEKFIASPYFNKGRNFIPFYKILKNYYPGFDNPELTEENIFKQLYPEKTYDKKSSTTMRVLESQLTRMAEKFLEIEEFAKSEDFTGNTFLKVLKEKGEHDLNISYGKKLIREFENKKISGSYFLSQYLLRKQIIRFHSYYDDNKHREFKKDNLENAIDFLLLNFINALIDYYGELSVYSSKHLPESKIFKEFESCFDFEKFISSFKNNDLLNDNLLNLTYYAFRIVKDKKDSQSYELLKELFFKLKDSLDYKYKRQIYIKLINFCNYQKLGEKKYYQGEFIDIYKLWIEDAPIEEADEVFSIRAIRNVIRSMVIVGRSDEIKEYITKYSKYFDEEIRGDCINFAHATLSFVEEDYEECLERISRHNFKIPMMIKDMKMMKIQTCYMLGYYDLLYSEIDTYRHFLASTSGISIDFINIDKKVLKYFHRFAGITEKKDKKELEYLSNELTELNSENIYLNWILLKTKNMLNNNFIHCIILTLSGQEEIVKMFI